MKYIELSTSKKDRICRALGVSRVTLWSALTFQTQSTLAEKIRRMAVQNGGRVMIKLDVTEGFMPNCEIDFVHDIGGVQRIIQTFSNGVRVEFDNATCTASISRDGRAVKMFSDVKVRDWGNIVFEAQSLTDSLNK